MRVLFLFLLYPKPHESSGMYAALVNEFVKNGHEVVIVSGSKNGESTSFTNENNAEVLRVKTQRILNVHPILKGIATVRFPFHLKKAISKYLTGRTFDLVIAPTPTITFVDVIAFLKKKYPVKACLILRDIFPQNARDLGMMTNPLLFNYFRRKEKKLYRYCDYIGCMSQGNIDYVIKHNPEVSPKKLFLLPNWQKVAPPTEGDFSVKEKYGLKGKFVAIFGGNIGEPQKIENIIVLAQAYHQNEDIVFLVIGEGTKKKYLEQLVALHNLKNVIVKDTLPRQDYERLVCNADIGLISLSEKFTIPNIPSKTLSYFNAKIPILAAIDEHTDYGQLLEKANAGLWSVTGDTGAYKQNFDTLYQNAELRKCMGENGYGYLLKYLTSERAYEAIVENIENAEKNNSEI